jgi:DNA-binding response OmpR family regulator
MHILLAETDLLCLREIRQALEQAGHHVTASTDGMGAWGYLVSAAPPDLLVTGLHLGAGMPPGTALGLHAHCCRPRIPVIYIPTSAEADYADPEHGAVLVKPFAVADLVATVRRLLTTPLSFPSMRSLSPPPTPPALKARDPMRSAT